MKHLTFANKVLQEAVAASEEGLFYAAKAFSWNECVMTTITDASFAGETKVIKISEEEEKVGT